MIDVDAFVNLRDVENGLRRMQLAGYDLRPVFQRARKAVRADQKQHAQKQQGPAGQWASLAASTIAHRKQRTGKQGRKRRRPIKSKRLRKLGRLPGAFGIKITPRSIAAISKVKWSGAHQPRSLSGSTRVGHGSQIEARPFLWASTGLLQTVSRLAVDHLVGAWERR